MSRDRQPLFRREAVPALRRGALGDPALAQPPALIVATAFALTAAALLVLLLTRGEYTQRTRVMGALVPDSGLATVTAPAAGVVTKAPPAEGRRVAAGERLLVIETAQATTGSGRNPDALLAELDRRRLAIVRGHKARRELSVLREDGLNRQLAALRSELSRLERSRALETQRVALADEALRRLETLAESGHLPGPQLDEQRERALERRAVLLTLERQAAALWRDRAVLSQALSEFPARRAEDDSVRAGELARLAQEAQRIRSDGEALVTAPVAGLLASRRVFVGQSVRAGQPVATLLPDGARLQARLFLPSRAAGFVERGDPVELRYAAFPYQKFGHHRGRIIGISRHALGAAELGEPAAALAGAEPVYRVIVGLPEDYVLAYGRREALLPGMLVEADVLGDTRRLYEWLLEPLYALSGRL